MSCIDDLFEGDDKKYEETVEKLASLNLSSDEQNLQQRITKYLFDESREKEKFSFDYEGQIFKFIAKTLIPRKDDEPFIILFRGIPGVGKTTLAEVFQKLLGMLITSADDYFKDIKFSSQHLDSAHFVCYSKFADVLKSGGSIGVHNTFTTISEMQRYFEHAQSNNISLIIVEPQPDRIFRSIHNVPERTINNMKRKWFPTTALTKEAFTMMHPSIRRMKPWQIRDQHFCLYALICNKNGDSIGLSDGRNAHITLAYNISKDDIESVISFIGAKKQMRFVGSPMYDGSSDSGYVAVSRVQLAGKLPDITKANLHVTLICTGDKKPKEADMLLQHSGLKFDSSTQISELKKAITNKESIEAVLKDGGYCKIYLSGN